MKETKIAIPIRTSDCGRYCADCRWCWWGGHWEDPGCAVLSDEHGKRLPLEMSDHGPERPTACLAAEQQAQGDAEGLRAALRSAARDLQTANQWSWEARWPADRIRWFAERSEVCRAAAKAGLPPKRPATAEDCPCEAPCESCGLPEDWHNPIVGSAGPCREYAPAAGAKDCLGSGFEWGAGKNIWQICCLQCGADNREFIAEDPPEDNVCPWCSCQIDGLIWGGAVAKDEREGEQGGGEWVAGTKTHERVHPGRYVSWEHGGKRHIRKVEVELRGDDPAAIWAGGGAMLEDLDLWQSPDGTPPPGVEE